MGNLAIASEAKEADAEAETKSTNLGSMVWWDISTVGTFSIIGCRIRQ